MNDNINNITKALQFLVDNYFKCDKNSIATLSKELPGERPLVVIFKGDHVNIEVAYMRQIEKQSNISYSNSNWLELFKQKVNNYTKFYQELQATKDLHIQQIQNRLNRFK